jgi:hypothetical protein
MITRVISRKEARAQGLKRYFTGKPCKHGHICERITSTWACLACVRRRYAAQRKERREYHRRYYAAHREKLLKAKRERDAGYLLEHPEAAERRRQDNRERARKQAMAYRVLIKLLDLKGKKDVDALFGTR